MTVVSTHLAPDQSPRQGIRPFLVLLTLLTSAYAVWMMTFWPGVLGEDSVAILLEVQSPDAF